MLDLPPKFDKLGLGFSHSRNSAQGVVNQVGPPCYIINFYHEIKDVLHSNILISDFLFLLLFLF